MPWHPPAVVHSFWWSCGPHLVPGVGDGLGTAGVGTGDIGADGGPTEGEDGSFGAKASEPTAQLAHSAEKEAALRKPMVRSSKTESQLTVHSVQTASQQEQARKLQAGRRRPEIAL